MYTNERVLDGKDENIVNTILRSTNWLNSIVNRRSDFAVDEIRFHDKFY